ncbi:hypothetical protein [uncultured Desulfosarcina sp.]|uniref:hypothetical protein n=1 Tax=uncultured Desulfosarcina sp. TaxID=218289 RepID=UPI0029C803B6|nr:hypothetical protein [uncultured Desulfosarcina sp.]
MGNKILRTICWLAGIGVGAVALVVVVGIAYSLILLLPEKTAVNDCVPESSLRSASHAAIATADADLTPPVPDGSNPHMASPLPATADRKPSKRGDPRLKSELIRDFRQFLVDRGHSVDELDQAVAATPPREPEPETSLDDALALPPEATLRLKEEYPVQDARRTPNGEVWIRLDPAEAEGLSVEELSAKAAELYGDGIDPLKIVVWVGNRARAVNTFNGHPIF